MRLTDRARVAACPRCQAATVRGLTPAPAAWAAAADPVPLDVKSEILALLAGKLTYDLAVIARRPRLIPRDQFRIGNRDWPVLAAHKCPGPVPYSEAPPAKTREDSAGTLLFCPF